MVHHSVPTINDDTSQPTTVPPVVLDKIAEGAEMHCMCWTGVGDLVV